MTFTKKYRKKSILNLLVLIQNKISEVRELYERRLGKKTWVKGRVQTWETKPKVHFVLEIGTVFLERH